MSGARHQPAAQKPNNFPDPYNFEEASYACGPMSALQCELSQAQVTFYDHIRSILREHMSERELCVELCGFARELDVAGELENAVSRASLHNHVSSVLVGRVYDHEIGDVVAQCGDEVEDILYCTRLLRASRQSESATAFLAEVVELPTTPPPTLLVAA